jgi:hypothetical protein
MAYKVPEGDRLKLETKPPKGPPVDVQLFCATDWPKSKIPTKSKIYFISPLFKVLKFV